MSCPANVRAIWAAPVRWLVSKPAHPRVRIGSARWLTAVVVPQYRHQVLLSLKLFPIARFFDHHDTADPY
jgi:hypothetical protein